MSRQVTWLRSLVIPLLLCVALPACAEGDATASQARDDIPVGTQPQPLKDKTSLTVAVPAPLELFAQPYLAKEFGEFEKENLDVRIVTLLPADAVTQLAAGKIDACICAFNPGIFNAISGGVEARAVAGTFSKLQDGVGVYVRPDFAGAQPQSLRGKRLAISSGYASAVVTDLQGWLAPAGMSLTDIEAINIPATDTLTALKSGGAEAAYLLAPFSDMAAKSGAGVFVPTTQPKSLSTGFFFGNRLLKREPAVGAAFLRAIVRTTRTYLQGDFHDNEKVVDAMAAAFDLDAKTIRSTDEVGFDSNLTTGNWPGQIESVQRIWAGLGDILEYDKPLEVNQLLDNTLLDNVVKE